MWLRVGSDEHAFCSTQYAVAVGAQLGTFTAQLLRIVIHDVEAKVKLRFANRRMFSF